MKNALLLLLSLALPAAAGDFSASAKGTTSADFLKLGVGARAEGLGEAFSAVVDDAGALYWNPAALNEVSGRSLTAMHAAYINSSFFDYAAYAQKLSAGAWGVGLQYLSAGNLVQTDATGTEIGGLTPHDLALSLGYARDWKGFDWGVGAKLIRSSILDTAQTFALDFGMLSPRLWGDKLRLAFTTVNLGGQLKFEQEGSNLPLAFRLGSALNLSRPWLLSLDVVFPRDNAPVLALGTEYWKAVNSTVKVAGRLGFNSRAVGDVTGFSGFSFGAGLACRSLSFDYAFVPFGTLGSAHRLSLGWHFSATRRNPSPPPKSAPAEDDSQD